MAKNIMPPQCEKCLHSTVCVYCLTAGVAVDKNSTGVVYCDDFKSICDGTYIPCYVGQEIYIIKEMLRGKRVLKGIILKIIGAEDDEWYIKVRYNRGTVRTFPISAFDRYIFTDASEARTKIKEK